MESSDSVDSERIIVRVEGQDIETGESKDFGADIYQLIKFRRSNQNTCITQKPLVKEGARVRKGDVLADGPSTEKGELALGRTSWSPLCRGADTTSRMRSWCPRSWSRRITFTSIHIEEKEIEARDTKLGPEEITRDIPNVSEAASRIWTKAV